MAVGHHILAGKNCFAFFALLLLLLSALNLHAANYYVDNGSAAASDSNPGTLALPWKTIAKANQTLAAGDTVYIRRGTYTNYISPTRTGTAASSITYRNYNNESVTVTGNTYAILLVNKSYINVDGIRFYLLDTFIDFQNSSHNDISNCIFDQMRNPGHWYGTWIRLSSQYNWFHHNVFSNFGYYDTDDIGALFDIGDEERTTDYSNYNLVENNTFFHGGHHVLGVFGRFNVVRNNYLHDENWNNGFGDRCFYLNGYNENSGFNLIESNRVAFAGQPPDNTEAAGMNLITHSNIVRFNSFYGSTGSGVMMGVTANYYTGPQYNKVYHNTFYKNGQSTNPGTGNEEKDGIGLANWGGTNPVVANVIKNNLFYGNPTSIGTYRVNLSDQIIAGNWQQTGDPLFIDITTPMDPNNGNLPDFRLRTNSPCVDKGVFLTSVTSSSGTGRTFQVADASYFIDGWGIVQGDQIQLQGTTQRAQITNIDYATKTLTVDSNLTWTQNQGVTLAYAGSAPDIGAFESSYATNSATATNPAPGAIVLEAESGTLSAPFFIQDGSIVQSALTSVTTGGRAAYSFTITNAGKYTITGIVNAPDDGANSCYLNIDAEPVDPTMIWSIPLTSGFEARDVSWLGNGTPESPKVFNLTAGPHTLIIRGREGGLQIDRLQIASLVDPRPVLALSSVAKKLVLSWPSWATNYTLESCSNLSPQTPWVTVTNKTTLSGTNSVLTNNMVGPAVFYRLRKN